MSKSKGITGEGKYWMTDESGGPTLYEVKADDAYGWVVLPKSEVERYGDRGWWPIEIMLSSVKWERAKHYN